MPSVYLRVLIIDLATRRPVVTATMGWVRTSHRLAVVWPSGARLSPGSYHVTVSAHDHRNGNILRNARISGQTTLTVKAAATPVTPSPPLAAPEAGVPTPAQTVADGAVFPVQGAHSFGGPENRFGAARAGHVHQGQDVLTAEGTPDVAPLAGTIESTANQPGGAGYYVVEHTLIGFDFLFAHCEARLVHRRRRPGRGRGPADLQGRADGRRDRARTCTSRCGSAAGRPEAATRSTRCPTSKPGKRPAPEVVPSPDRRADGDSVAS